MRLGTLEVWARLPEGSSHITEKQIHEALWHYYYDVDKTVGYLVASYITKAKEQKKAAVGKKATGEFHYFLSSMDSRAFELELSPLDESVQYWIYLEVGGFSIVYKSRGYMSTS